MGHEDAVEYGISTIVSVNGEKRQMREIPLTQDMTIDGWVERLVVCEGVTPLLLSPMTDEIAEKIDSKTGNFKVDISPEEIARMQLIYHNERLALPIEYLRMCLKLAGEKVPYIGKSNITRAADGFTFLSSLLMFHEDYFYLTGPGTWKIDRRTVPAGDAKRVVKTRARIDEWGFEVPISINTEEVDERIVQKLFFVAGKQRGLGSFRPGRGGNFGMFKVVKWLAPVDGE